MAQDNFVRQSPLLVLIDGHALVHRAYHALPPFSIAKTGEPTGAVYGFASMLLKVLEELKPTHYAIAFDRPTPTFRHLRYEEYKAQRPKAPDDLVAQFKRVRQLVDTFHIPAFEMDGYEADDILGTLARQAAEMGMDAVIVTGDYDTLQLVGPRVRVFAPKGYFSDTILYDEARVRERYGVEPAQVADFKGLKGDPSDNIPGVAGIGDKTATRLVQQFGSMEAIFEHLDDVTPPKLRETLRASKDIALESKHLSLIDCDVPVKLELDACRVTGYDRAQAVELFRELEFASLLSKLPEALAMGRDAAATVEIAKVSQPSYSIVNTSEALDSLLTRVSAASLLVLDLETTSLDAMRADIVGISLAIAPQEAGYIPVGHRWDGSQLSLDYVLDRLRPILSDSGLPKAAHNANYDLTVLGRYGVAVQNLAFDSMIAAHLLGEKSLGLKALAFGRLGIEMTPITALIGTGSNQLTMDKVLVAEAAPYACADADMTLRLCQLLERELKQEEGLWRLFTEVEMPFVPVLVRMQINGVALDTAFLRAMSQELGEEMQRLEAAIYDWVGHHFNINSSQQLAGVLFDELHLPSNKRTKSGYSTDAAVLEGLRSAHPVIGQILDYRQLAKLKSTYIDALPALINPNTGRVHTSFNQTGTTTGRISSSDPNLQNIPVRTEQGRQVRRAFTAAPGNLLLAADYSQIDLRALAHLSQDDNLIAAFLHDEDIHTATAAQVFGVAPEGVTSDMRRLAKTVNFGVIYGMGEYGLASRTELSKQEADHFITTYFGRYPEVKRYQETIKRQARERGYVETVLGRRRYIPEINAANGQVRQAAERMAINMPVQGTSADIIKLAMIDIQRELDKRHLKSLMTLQVHDELIFEVPQGELEEMRELVAERMPRALELRVPLKVDLKVGINWGELE